jgi:hypothetical protein
LIGLSSAKVFIYQFKRYNKTIKYEDICLKIRNREFNLYFGEEKSEKK